MRLNKPKIFLNTNNAMTGEINDSFWTWVEAHRNDDPVKLRLKFGSRKDGFDYDSAITQIDCRNRFSKKLSSTISENPRFLFPSRLSGEQSTSDRLAEFHATLVRENETMADMTAGLGIDVLHCSSRCSHALAIELNPATADALRYNVAQSHYDNIDVVCGDCRDVLNGYNDHQFGTIFIDPARRSDNGARLYSLADCKPDVVEMLPMIAQHCRRLVVKMSPMLDVSHTIESLGGCNRIISLGNATECKELIAIKEFEGERAFKEPTIEAITLLPNERYSIFTYTRAEESSAPHPNYSAASEGEYFYEPYPSVIKLTAGKLLAERFGLKAFHPNCRLYHSDKLIEDFPGEIFTIENVIEFSSKNLKRFKSEYPVINVSTRNFVMNTDALRQKLGVKDGGNKRVLGLTDNDNKRKLLILKSI